MHKLRKYTAGPALAATALLALAGCADYGAGRTEVTGRVEQEGSGQALAGAEVRLFQSKGGGSWASSAYHPVPDVPPVTSDARGRFAMTFEAEGGGDYILMASRDPGYQTNWGSQGQLTGGRKNKDVRVGVHAPAWVQLDLVKESPYSGYYISFPDYAKTIINARDTSLVFQFPTTGEIPIYWVIEGGNNLVPAVRHQEWFTLVPLDTIHYRLAF